MHSAEVNMTGENVTWYKSCATACLQGTVHGCGGVPPVVVENSKGYSLPPQTN